MSTFPTITVIIPAYNAAKYIGHAIESALHQSYPPLEILVIDDGSHDDTAAIVAQYRSPVRYIRQQNGGPAAARNRGAREAQGEWLALLDADDIWLPGKLERQAIYMGDPRVGIIHCFREGQPRSRIHPDKITFDTLWERNCVDNSSVLIRKTAFDQAGGFDEDRALIAVEDYNLWLRLAALGWEIATCPEDLWRYTPAPGNLSSQIERFALAELANIEKVQKQNLITPDRAVRKRVTVLEEYGRQLLYYRQLSAARRMLFDSLRLYPTLSRFGWWMATFLPGPMLDWRRAKAAGKG